MAQEPTVGINQPQDQLIIKGVCSAAHKHSAMKHPWASENLLHLAGYGLVF